MKFKFLASFQVIGTKVWEICHNRAGLWFSRSLLTVRIYSRFIKFWWINIPWIPYNRLLQHACKVIEEENKRCSPFNYIVIPHIKLWPIITLTMYYSPTYTSNWPRCRRGTCIAPRREAQESMEGGAERSLRSPRHWGQFGIYLKWQK